MQPKHLDYVAMYFNEQSTRNSKPGTTTQASPAFSHPQGCPAGTGSRRKKGEDST